MAAMCKVTKMNVQRKRQEAVCCVISHQGCPNLLVYNHLKNKHYRTERVQWCVAIPLD